MANIPGSDALGFGFDVMKTYDLSSKKARVIRSSDKKVDTRKIGAETFDVPENVAFAPKVNRNGKSEIYSSRKQVEEHFKSKANVSGSGFGFTGQVDAAYSTAVTSDRSYYYGMVEAWDDSFTLSLAETDDDWLAAGFKKDAATMPDEFNEQNKKKFFALFAKYGTHYVKEVSLGGHLYYYVSIQKSDTMSETKARASMVAEYEGMFGEAKATAQASWQKVDQEYTNSRTVRISAQGGDTSILEAVTPSPGTWKGEDYKKWIKTLGSEPGVSGFTLEPISSLFSLDKSDAVDAALGAYLNAGIIVTSNRNATPGGGPAKSYPTIIVNGKLIKPPAPKDLPGVQVVLIEPDTHEILMNRDYYMPPVAGGENRMYRDLARDLGAITAPKYRCAVAFFGLFTAYWPPPEVSGWLESNKAKLSSWKEYIGKTAAGANEFCYTFIGGTGMGATEDFRIKTTSGVGGNVESTSKYFLYSKNVQLQAGAKGSNGAESKSDGVKGRLKAGKSPVKAGKRPAKAGKK